MAEQLEKRAPDKRVQTSEEIRQAEVLVDRKAAERWLRRLRVSRRPDGSVEVSLAPEGGVVCDFCSGAPVAAAYPARSFVAATWPGGMTTSDGWWAACRTCARLVDAGDGEELALRSLATSTLLDELPRAVHLSLLSELHRAFWSNRTGPAVPVDPN